MREGNAEAVQHSLRVNLPDFEIGVKLTTDNQLCSYRSRYDRQKQLDEDFQKSCCSEDVTENPVEDNADTFSQLAYSHLALKDLIRRDFAVFGLPTSEFLRMKPDAFGFPRSTLLIRCMPSKVSESTASPLLWIFGPSASATLVPHAAACTRSTLTISTNELIYSRAAIHLTGSALGQTAGWVLQSESGCQLAWGAMPLRYHDVG